MIELSPRSSATDDVELLRGAAAGDWECIAGLYDRHRERALAVAISVLADPSEAEDVVHDAFVNLPRMARSYDPRRGRFPQWLNRSVRNRAIDHVRRRARVASRTAPSVKGPEDLLALTAARSASPLDEAEAQEFLDLVARLDGRYAHLIRLAFVDGWSHSAIARLTGLPLGTVKTRIRNSLRQLRLLMDEAAVAGVAGPHEPGLGVESVIAVHTRDRRLAAAVRAHAAGLARVEVIDRLPGRAIPRPAGAVLDLRSAPAMIGDCLDRIEDAGWGTIPLLLLARLRDRDIVPRRAGLTLAINAGDPPHLDLESAITALLSADSNPRVRGVATDQLMRSVTAAVVVGDRLGRIRGATAPAALLFGRTPRQLVGSFITDLSATPTARTERQWQHLATTGWWAGRSLARRPTGSPLPIWGRAWMSPGSGFVGTYAPDRLS